MLISNKINFFDNALWPESSPDLNVAEKIGSTLKVRTEEALQKYSHAERMKQTVLKKTLSEVLKEMEDDCELFRNLFRSHPARLAAVASAGGLHTEY